jgi:5-methylcytosine-specific restriction endonuclease McrA
MSSKTKKSHYIRKGREYLPHEIFDNIGNDSKCRVDFDGDKIKMGSMRYKVFRKQLQCDQCGIEGKYFCKEKASLKVEGYHFNLYAIGDNGDEMLMTKDHIVPKSKGGPDSLKNLVTMCSTCNFMKSNVVGPLTPALLLEAAAVCDTDVAMRLKDGADMLKRFQTVVDTLEHLEKYITLDIEGEVHDDATKIQAVNKVRTLLRKPQYGT